MSEKDDWLPIDYSQANSGKGCFHGRPVLIKKDEFIASAKFIDGRWSISGRGIIQGWDCATHYRPIPKGWIE